MNDNEARRRAVITIQEEIQRDLAREKELKKQSEEVKCKTDIEEDGDEIFPGNPEVRPCIGGGHGRGKMRLSQDIETRSDDGGSVETPAAARDLSLIHI